MARYEGMDEIIKRVARHLGQEPTRIDDRPMRAHRTVTPVEDERYGAAVEYLCLLLRDAEQLHHTLTEDPVRSLSHREHDDVSSLLRKVTQELWSCENALERLAPID